MTPEGQQAVATDALDLIARMRSWAERKCPCENEQPNPCPLCGADVDKPNDVCRAVDNTFPDSFVTDMVRLLNRTALEAKSHD